MEEITHRIVDVNGIKMHVAEMGQGEGRPVVLLLHGYPDLWFSWRHQILALSKLGFHTVAPDMRGYGDTDSPSSISSYTYHHLVGDIVALIHLLGVEQVHLVAHDWGAYVGWHVCLFRPDLIRSYVCLSVPLKPREPAIKPVAAFRRFFGEDHYIVRNQEPGAMEAVINRVGVAEYLRRTLTLPLSPTLPKGDTQVSQEEDGELPPWITKEDIAYYSSKFSAKGFTGPLSYYRALDLNWELTAPWTGAKVEVPVKFVVGDLDLLYNSPGMKEYVHSGKFKETVPKLEDVVVMEGVGHFLNQEKPEEITAHIHHFISKY